MRQRRAFQTAREPQMNNMHLSFCIPNSDSRRFAGQKALRLAEDTYLSGLIMFL